MRRRAGQVGQPQAPIGRWAAAQEQELELELVLVLVLELVLVLVLVLVLLLRVTFSQKEMLSPSLVPQKEKVSKEL
jgi:hypothetical protein